MRSHPTKKKLRLTGYCNRTHCFGALRTKFLDFKHRPQQVVFGPVIGTPNKPNVRSLVEQQFCRSSSDACSCRRFGNGNRPASWDGCRLKSRELAWLTARLAPLVGTRAGLG